MTGKIEKLLYTPSIFFFVGSPGSGKSFAIKRLLYKFKHKFLFGLVVCPTAFNKGYNYVDKRLILTNFDEKRIKLYINHLKKTKKEGFLILDDCVGIIAWNSNQLIAHIFTCHRHYGLTIFVSSQYFYKISPLVREVSNVYFIFGSTNKRTIVAIFENVICDEVCGEEINNWRELKKFIVKKIGKHQCLFFDKLTDTSEVMKFSEGKDFKFIL